MTTYFSKEHEWLSVDGDTATLGITEHAAEQLGEIVYVEQKEVGETFESGDEMGIIESVKAASEIYAPVDGEIVAVNEELADAPANVNESPEDSGWLFKIKISNAEQLNELMDRDAYDAFVG